MLCERLSSDHSFLLSFQIQFDCIIQIQKSQRNVSVVSRNSNMILIIICFYIAILITLLALRFDIKGEIG